VKSDTPYLGHILDSIAAIETYTAGGRDAFMADRLIQDAVIRNFEIIGEAANRLSPAIRGQPNIAWGNVIAFRNRLIRAYWSVDLALVWGRDRERSARIEGRDAAFAGRFEPVSGTNE
jgi:uncharacterized protein with HEPN domain